MKPHITVSETDSEQSNQPGGSIDGKLAGPKKNGLIDHDQQS